MARTYYWIVKAGGEPPRRFRQYEDAVRYAVGHVREGCSINYRRVKRPARRARR